ncbi:MAG: hypothetical protein FWH11_14925 [Micrococcales bacterium]|nr:hypothetical protein [Micrococcales bacterium]
MSGSRLAGYVRPLRRRRRPGLWAFALVLVVVGALTSWFLVSAAAGTVQVVSMGEGKQRGEVITRGDVVLVELPRDTPLAFVPGEQIDTVVGQVAQVDLLPGVVLVPGAYGPRLLVPQGRTVLGVPVQHPGPEVRAGDRVRLVLGLTADGDLSADQPAWDATVVRTDSAGGRSGNELQVVVEVDAADVDELVWAATTGRVNYALLGGPG